MVEEEAFIVSVLLHEGLQPAWENVALAPGGSPDTENDISRVGFAIKVVVITVVPDSPCDAVTSPEFEIAKSKGENELTPFGSGEPDVTSLVFGETHDYVGH